jgi:hypothetical protein
MWSWLAILGPLECLDAMILCSPTNVEATYLIVLVYRNAGAYVESEQRPPNMHNFNSDMRMDGDWMPIAKVAKLFSGGWRTPPYL